MKLKKMDAVYCPKRNVCGQVLKIVQNIATIQFVTGERIQKNLLYIIYRDNQWVIND
jgi:hypothetical protein